ncbi:MAG TPA: glycosyltransferase N-terminal domain-containing protein [Planctomycetota bacterium]|nr:glycosyltransferase N-terminal domain-containing protein [Planctomycetota bacterium]
MSTARSRARVAVAHLAYDGLALLAAAVLLVPWLLRAARDVRQRRLLRERFGRLPPGAPAGRPVWVHAVSVGEVKASRPLVRELQRRHPALPVVISTSTPTGLDTALGAFPGLYVFHAPLDLAPVVRRVLRRLRPRLLVLMELEAWPALLAVADAEGVPRAVVNGRITEKSFRGYQRLHWWVPEFDRLDLVAAQDETYAQRFERLGVPRARIHVTGNLKHEPLDGASRGADTALAAELGLDDGRPVFVAGSTHAGEDEAALEAWRAAGGAAAAHFVLVPRHVTRVPDIRRTLERAGASVVLRSQSRAGRPAADVLLVDRMGELEALFALATVVFLGGSLVPVGGHNVLEPAAAGRPVLVGPHLESCRAEAELLRRAGGLRVVADARELGAALAGLLADPAACGAMGAAARAAAAGLRGAAQADVALLQQEGLLAVPALEGSDS